jgi:hypothetical protein
VIPWEYGGSEHGFSLNLAQDSHRNFMHFIPNHGVALTEEAEAWFDLGLIDYEITLGYSYVFVDIPLQSDRLLFKMRWF